MSQEPGMTMSRVGFCMKMTCEWMMPAFDGTYFTKELHCSVANVIVPVNEPRIMNVPIVCSLKTFI